MRLYSAVLLGKFKWSTINSANIYLKIKFLVLIYYYTSLNSEYKFLNIF